MSRTVAQINARGPSFRLHAHIFLYLIPRIAHEFKNFSPTNLIARSHTPLPLLVSAGELDMFVLLLYASDGSERCYYQAGTGANDVITSVLADGDGGAYPNVTVSGYTEGPLAGPHGK